MWDIASQTKIKLIILEKYLRAWATVLKDKAEILYYIDGFAGPGWYNDPESGEKVAGSPVQAVQFYLQHKLSKGWKYELRFINVEKDANTFRELKKQTSRFETKARIINIEGEFLQNLSTILEEIQDNHSFFFIDPFGISGIEFDQVKRVLERDRTEILIKFSYNELQRCLGDLKNVQNPDATIRTKARTTISTVSKMMGLTIENLKELESPETYDESKEKRVLASYLSNLRLCKLCVYPFKNNFPGSKRTFYYLIFLTDNPIGLKIMKDIMYLEMKKELRQLLLFPPGGETSVLADKLLTSYKKQRVRYYKILEEWLSKSQYVEGEDYLEKDIEKALEILQENGSVNTYKTPGYKHPIYIFGKTRRYDKSGKNS